MSLAYDVYRDSVASVDPHLGAVLRAVDSRDISSANLFDLIEAADVLRPLAAVVYDQRGALYRPTLVFTRDAVPSAFECRKGECIVLTLDGFPAGVERVDDALVQLRLDDPPEGSRRALTMLREAERFDQLVSTLSEQGLDTSSMVQDRVVRHQARRVHLTAIHFGRSNHAGLGSADDLQSARRTSRLSGFPVRQQSGPQLG